MAYHVAVAQFEGPLDLLVQLVEANQLEVTAISAAAVTEQFLAVVDQMGQEELGELGRYLDLAARLLVIKSLALLPEKAEQEPRAELERLEEELELYRRNRLRARFLADRWAASRRSYRRPLQPRPFREARLPSAEALQAVLRNMADSRPAWEKISAPSITLARMLERVQARLSSRPEPLHGLIEAADGPSEIALLLVAVLDLMKNQKANIHQPEPFGSILVSRHA